MKKKKAQKNLTNEHLLKGQENNFALAEAAIKIAREQMNSDHEFSLDQALNAVAKKKELEKAEDLIEQLSTSEEV